jgi:hypothetical protein
VRIEWYKIHGGKKDSNIWKETSQKQKAGLEKLGECCVLKVKLKGV